MERSASFDPTRRYRYGLRRCWQPSAPILTFIMLNPSTADQQQDDPTIRRCIQLSQGWGYGTLQVVNLFAYCTAHPRELKTVGDPIGAENDAHLWQACESSDRILLAWGNGGSLYQRDRIVLAHLEPLRDRLVCLGTNRTGHPRHPLYVPKGRGVVPWEG